MRSEAKVLPSDFLERLKRILPPQKLDAIANTFTDEKPTTFRVNTLKASVSEIKESLARDGFRLESVSWYPEAFVIRHGRLRELQETSFYKEGKIYVQNLSSMIPPLVLNPEPGETILDLTAAPGSKTTQMAVMMQGTGKIIANDNNKTRFFKLRFNVELQGAGNVETTLKHGEVFGKIYPGQFDKVLLDAPCSAEGRFSATEPATYKFWKVDKVDEMARKQKRLMYSAATALKPGGILVYSTCTFAPEENEGMLDWVFRKFPGQFEIEKILLSIPNQMPGLGRWEKEVYDPAVRYGLRVLPNSVMEGFFVAKLRKIQ